MSVPMRWGPNVERTVTGIKNPGRKASVIPPVQFVGVKMLGTYHPKGTLIKMHRRGGGHVEYIVQHNGSLVRA